MDAFIAEHSTMTNLKQPTLTEQETKKVLDAVRGLRFGSVEITVHEGRIVQVERKEKIRLNISLKDLENEARSNDTD
jgi:hypothetical protein